MHYLSQMATSRRILGPILAFVLLFAVACGSASAPETTAPDTTAPEAAAPDSDRPGHDRSGHDRSGHDRPGQARPNSGTRTYCCSKGKSRTCCAG